MLFSMCKSSSKTCHFPETCWINLKHPAVGDDIRRDISQCWSQIQCNKVDRLVPLNRRSHWVVWIYGIPKFHGSSAFPNEIAVWGYCLFCDTPAFVHAGVKLDNKRSPTLQNGPLHPGHEYKKPWKYRFEYGAMKVQAFDPYLVKRKADYEPTYLTWLQVTEIAHLTYGGFHKWGCYTPKSSIFNTIAPYKPSSYLGYNYPHLWKPITIVNHILTIH